MTADQMLALLAMLTDTITAQQQQIAALQQALAEAQEAQS